MHDAEFAAIYQRLNIRGLEERGESFYQPHMKALVQMLVDKNLVSVGETVTECGDVTGQREIACMYVCVVFVCVYYVCMVYLCIVYMCMHVVFVRYVCSMTMKS